jgi:hypothetical protein
MMDLPNPNTSSVHANTNSYANADTSVNIASTNVPTPKTSNANTNANNTNNNFNKTMDDNRIQDLVKLSVASAIEDSQKQWTLALNTIMQLVANSANINNSNSKNDNNTNNITSPDTKDDNNIKISMLMERVAQLEAQAISATKVHY